MRLCAAHGCNKKACYGKDDRTHCYTHAKNGWVNFDEYYDFIEHFNRPIKSDNLYLIYKAVKKEPDVADICIKSKIYFNK